MLRLFLHWILNAVALLIVSHVVDGFVISGLVSALIAVIVIGLAFNATLGFFLKLITLPLGILTFGLFFLVINAVILYFLEQVCAGFCGDDLQGSVSWSAGAGRAASAVCFLW